MPNQEAILENIRKLESMGLHGEELLQQLEAIGIPRTQAERWVRQARTQSTPLPEEALEQSSTTTKTTYYEIPAATPASMPPKPSVQPNYAAPQPDISIEKLWEKGILATVDAKLSQMEQIKKELDNKIESKVGDHYSVMEKKLETLFDAQRELFRMKMDAQLDAKTKEVEEILNQKIEEIKRLNLATQEDLQRTKGQKMVIEDLMQNMTSKAEALDHTKRMITDDTTQKLEELQEKVDELIQTTEERVKDVEGRAAKTLELEEKVTAGLAEQMQVQANTILDERIKDLREELKKEIIQLKKLGTDLASKDIQETIEQFESMNKKLEASKKELDSVVEKKARDMDSMIEKKVLEIDKIVNTKMETVVNQKEQSFFKKIEDSSDELNKTKRDLSQKLLEMETRLQSLDVFQKQFINTIKNANIEREDQNKSFKTKLESFEARADEKIAIIDQRMKQLDSVITQLSQLMTQWQSSTRNQTNAPPLPSEQKGQTNVAIPNKTGTPNTKKTGLSKLFK